MQKNLNIEKITFKIVQMKLLAVMNDWSEARVDPLAALLIQGGGQTGKYQAVVLRAT